MERTDEAEGFDAHSLAVVCEAQRELQEHRGVLPGSLQPGDSLHSHLQLVVAVSGLRRGHCSARWRRTTRKGKEGGVLTVECQSSAARESILSLMSRPRPP